MKIPVWSRRFPEGVGNYRRRRFAETGKGFVAERATRRLRSSLPLYRDRVNPATGHPRADDREVYGRRDEALSRMRLDRLTQEQARRLRATAWEHGPDAYRSGPAREVTASRQRINEHADRVLGPGRSARAAEAMRQAEHNPWARPPGRSR